MPRNRCIATPPGQPDIIEPFTPQEEAARDAEEAADLVRRNRAAVEQRRKALKGTVEEQLKMQQEQGWQAWKDFVDGIDAANPLP